MSLFTRKEKRFAWSLAEGLINLIAFSFCFAVAFIIYGGKTMRRISRNIRNYFHYKDIEYSYDEIKQKILEMSGFQFEKFCGKLFEQLGHKVEYTPCSSDYGRDLVLNNNTFVECKHYTGNNLQIGRVICEKLIGSMEAFNITEGIIMTTGQIHENAYEYADRLLNKHLSFLKLEDIMEMINKIESTKIPLMIESSFSYPEEKFTTILKEIYE